LILGLSQFTLANAQTDSKKTAQFKSGHN